jgi:integrase
MGETPVARRHSRRTLPASDTSASCAGAQCCNPPARLRSPRVRVGDPRTSSALNDLDFGNKTIRVNKSADDNTREMRQPKTKASVALLPMPSALEATLRNYLLHWKPNARGTLFATRNGERPRSRDNVVRVGLKPVLRKLGIRAENTGLHAFRHGLATEHADAAVPVPVLQ